MLSLNDIINASFRKSGFSGYRTDDVDQFIDQVKESYDALLKKNLDQKEEYEKLKSENDQLLEKIKILAAKVENYRMEEDEIKNALVSAQKLGDASIRESRHKAEIIIKDANIKAERIISGAKQSVIEQQSELERLQKSVSDFRSKLLSAYKEHLTLIDALPTQKAEPKAAEKEPLHEPVQNIPVEQPAAVPEEKTKTSFDAEVCIFDDELPDSRQAAPHFNPVSYSNDYDISDDSDSPDGILNQN
jgi:cell division initiation protein